MKDHYLLVIFDDVKVSGTKAHVEPLYKEALKVYNQSGKNFTIKPSLYKLMKEPK
jgi:hypothetical protein